MNYKYDTYAFLVLRISKKKKIFLEPKTHMCQFVYGTKINELNAKK
jgi:hypothetical protein